MRILSLVAPLLVRSDNGNQVCENGWTPHSLSGQTFCWKVLGNTIGREAKEMCAEQDAKVPLPKSSKENAEMSSLAYKLKTGGRFWLGITDSGSEGRWRDFQGNLFGEGKGKSFVTARRYQNWNTNEPNNFGSGEDYATTLSNGRWNDIDGWYHKTHLLCQKSTNYGGCDNGWTLHPLSGQNFCWKVLGQTIGQVAKGKCAELAAWVPLPTSAKENAELVSFAQRLNVYSFWLGITDSGREGTWFDFEGNLFGTGRGTSFRGALKYQNWNGPSNEPNNWGTGEDYASMWPSGKWNDYYDSKLNPLLCQKTPTYSGAATFEKTVANQYKYNVVTNEADQYSHFKIDGSEFRNDMHFALSNLGGHSNKKWEIVIGGWGGRQSVIRKDAVRAHTTPVVIKKHSLADFNNIKGDIRVFVSDGELIIRSGNDIFMQYKDSSIRKNELNYLLVSGGWGGHGTYRITGFFAEGRFLWENNAINENGLITVSSNWPGHVKEHITDGRLNTFWHSIWHECQKPSFVTYTMKTVQTITKVTVGVRPDCCQDRYKNMYVTLKRRDGSVLAEKYTTGAYGEPFLTPDRKYIAVPFDPVNDVGVITISFHDKKCGQIQSLSVAGNTGRGTVSRETSGQVQILPNVCPSGGMSKVEYSLDGDNYYCLTTEKLLTGKSLQNDGYRYAPSTETWDTWRYPRDGRLPLTTTFTDSQNVHWRITLNRRESQLSFIVPISRELIFWGDNKDTVRVDAKCRFAELTFSYQDSSWWNSHGIRLKTRGYIDKSDGNTDDIQYWKEVVQLAGQTSKPIIDWMNANAEQIKASAALITAVKAG